MKAFFSLFPCCRSKPRASNAVTARGEKTNKTPKELGYSIPDEWEPRDGTMMIFPRKYHYGKEIIGLRKEFCNIAKAIARNEAVHVFCTPEDEGICRQQFFGEEKTGANINITIHSGKFTIDWARDNAPILLRSSCGSKLLSAGFQCNGWGKKYWGWKKDVSTRSNIAEAMNWPSVASDFCLEGGSIETCSSSSIGGNIAISTESCTLHKNRNNPKHWSKPRVEDELCAMLGLEQILWLPSGLVPDPQTDGHVDGLVKWIDANTVLLHTIDPKYKDEDPQNYAICQKAKTILESFGIKIVEVPLAEDMVHLNFYIGSGGDIAYVPICGESSQDEPAISVIRQHFATVVPLLAKHLGKAGGGIHCITQPIPKLK